MGCPPTAAAPWGLAEPPPTPALAGGRAPPRVCPELNPVEGLWSSLKAVELANLTSPTLAEVIDQAHRGIERVRCTPHLASSFLRHAGLSVS
jgi:transposase